jgi:hypothetical protein
MQLFRQLKIQLLAFNLLHPKPNRDLDRSDRNDAVQSFPGNSCYDDDVVAVSGPSLQLVQNCISAISSGRIISFASVASSSMA